MKLIAESVIDATLNEWDKEQAFEAAIYECTLKQPVLLSYIQAESFDLLTKDEKMYFLFLGITIWKTIQQNDPDIPKIEETALGDAEEHNWMLLNNVTSKTFRDRVTVFFEDTEQEDLLAFIEDSLVIDDEEGNVTKEGREIMFVGLKSIIDCLCQ